MDIKYKTELALQLIKRFGMSVSIEICRNNEWESVLHIIELKQTHAQMPHHNIKHNIH